MTPLNNIVDERPSKVIPVLLFVAGRVDDGVIQQRRDQTKLCLCVEIVRLLLDSLGILPTSIPQEQVSSTKCCLIFFKE